MAASELKLWNGVELKVLGVTGEFSSGKSFFVISIDPENTCLVDLEDSSAVYASYMPLKTRYSLYHEVTKWLKEKNVQVKGVPSPSQCYQWFYDLVVNKIQPGDYTVLAIDPISDIEQGMVSYISENPEDFGLSRGQLEKASGLLWGAMKSHWKLLLGVLSEKVETLAFTTHQGSIFRDGRPVPGKRKARGKETLTELASAYFLLQRGHDNDGKAQGPPSAIVQKSRLALPVKRDGGWTLVPMFPPRIPVCTYPELLKLIASPKDASEWGDEYQYVEPELTEEEKIQAQMDLADRQVEAARAQIELETLRSASMKRRAEWQASTSIVTELPVIKDSPEINRDTEVSEPAVDAEPEQPQHEHAVEAEKPSPLSEGIASDVAGVNDEQERSRLRHGIGLLAVDLFPNNAQPKLAAISKRISPQHESFRALGISELEEVHDNLLAIKDLRHALRKRFGEKSSEAELKLIHKINPLFSVIDDVFTEDVRKMTAALSKH